MELSRTRGILLIGVVASLLSFHAWAANGPELAGDWRITRVARAPWASAEDATLSYRDWIGRTVAFTRDRVDGPGVLHCGHAALEPTRYPAEALFQGSLPAPAAAAAQELGIGHLPVPGTSLNCDTGLFEFHRVDAETELLALDNQILTLTRSPGTLASADSAEGRVQGFLEFHFAADMGFSPDSVKARKAWFSKALAQAMASYFAKPTSEDEVPAIDGDPLTDSQEYPRRFAVGTARMDKETAEVPVRFADAFRDNTVTYRLRRENGAWLIDDLQFTSGDALRELLE